MKETLSKNRTFLMGLAMISVVLFHHGWTIVPGITAFFSRFGLWGVDIFLFLSGFGCVYALNKYSINQFFKRRVQRLLPTCLIAGIIIYLIDFYFHAERSTTFTIVQLFSLHRWYIQAIVLCYILCPLAYAIIKSYRTKGLLLMVGIAILAEWLTPEFDIYRLKWIFGRIPVFLVGMYVATFDLKLTKTQCAISVFCLVIAVLTRCIWGGYGIFQWTYFLAAAMPFICQTLCRLNNVFVKIHLSEFIKIMGLYSLEIYLIHEYFYWALHIVDIPMWSRYILYIIVVPPLCFAVKCSADYLVKKLRF